MQAISIYGYLAIGFIFGILVLIVILLVTLIKQGYKTKHIQMMNSAEASTHAEYQKLAERSFLMQQAMKEGQDKIVTELAQLRTRVGAIEQLLREVE